MQRYTQHDIPRLNSATGDSEEVSSVSSCEGAACAHDYSVARQASTACSGESRGLCMARDASRASYTSYASKTSEQPESMEEGRAGLDRTALLIWCSYRILGGGIIPIDAMVVVLAVMVQLRETEAMNCLFRIGKSKQEE